MSEWKTERHFAKEMLVEGRQTDALRELIRAFIDTKGETVSRLAKAAHGPQANGTDLFEFLNRRRRIGPAPATRLVDAINNYPAGFKQGVPRPEIAYTRTAEYRMAKDMNANRDAAQQRRRAHIEACRQAEIAKYGFTTIDGDVMDLPA
jgi:hypothetical protein